jgi:soluble lytic murein transglycosylase
MNRRWLLLILIVLVMDMAVGVWWWRRWRENRFDNHIIQAARRYGVAPALIKAVIWKESSFNPRACGRAQEMGLMQIRLPAASEWAAAEQRRELQSEILFDPATNITVGAWYLAKLLKRYTTTDYPIVFALADYNAGRSNVLRWKHGTGNTNSTDFLAQMDFPGTKKYVTEILQRERHYALP